MNPLMGMMGQPGGMPPGGMPPVGMTPGAMPPRPPGAMLLGPGNPMDGYTAMPPVCGPANGGDCGPLMAALGMQGPGTSVPQAADPFGGMGPGANGGGADGDADDPLAAALGLGGRMMPGMGQMPGMPPVPMQPPAGGPPMM